MSDIAVSACRVFQTTDTSSNTATARQVIKALYMAAIIIIANVYICVTATTTS